MKTNNVAHIHLNGVHFVNLLETWLVVLQSELSKTEKIAPPPNDRQELWQVVPEIAERRSRLYLLARMIEQAKWQYYAAVREIEDRTQKRKNELSAEASALGFSLSYTTNAAEPTVCVVDYSIIATLLGIAQSLGISLTPGG